MLAALLTDIRLLARVIRKRPLAFCLPVATVVLVSGAGTAVLAVANATLIRPMPFSEPDELASIHLLPPGVTSLDQANPLHPLDFVRLRQRLTTADGPEGIWSVEVGVGGDGDPESVPAGRVSSGFFGILGARAVAGRTFTAEEEDAGAAVVVLAHGLWQRRFGGRADIVGQGVFIDRVRHEVIGVMAADFEPLYVPADLWVPLGIREGNLIRANATFIRNVLRRRPGMSLADVTREVSAIMAAVEAESPESLTGWVTGLRTLREATFGSQRAPLGMLIVAVLVLALIAATNLMHLTLARVIAAQPELALRRALGATRRRIVTSALVEATAVAAVGGVIGLIVARLSLPAILALDPTLNLPVESVQLDWRVFAGTIALAWLVTAASTLAPQLGASDRSQAALLSQGSARARGSRESSKLRGLLVVAETALATVLIVSAALVLNGFDQTSRIQPGFDTNAIFGAQLRLPEAVYDTVEKRSVFLDRMLEAVRSVPGVRGAGTSMNLLIPGFAYVTLVYTEDPPVPNAPARTVQFRRISEAYFMSVGVPLLEGRDFDTHDAVGGELVAIVSRQFAESYWPGQPAVGRFVRRGVITLPPLRVVGVVGDVWDVGFGQEPQPTIYVPYRQSSTPTTPISLMIRGTDDTPALRQAVAEAVWTVDPNQPLTRVTALEAYMQDSLGPQRFRSTLLAVFAGLGLLLAVVGIYGVTARSVVERRCEIGIRMALGGQPLRIWRHVAGRSLLAVLGGIGLGVLAVSLVEPVLEAYLPEFGRLDIAIGWPVVVLLLAAGTSAAVLPARRALGVDPLTVLRGD